MRIAVGTSSTRTDDLGALPGRCPFCGEEATQRLIRSYHVLHMLGFLPTRYAHLTYGRRCAVCKFATAIARPDHAPAMPLRYRFGWVLVLALVIGACALYFQRMGACDHRSGGVGYSTPVPESEHASEMRRLAHTVLVERDAASKSCSDQLDAVQAEVAPRLFDVRASLPVRAEVADAALRPNTANPEWVTPGDALFGTLSTCLVPFPEPLESVANDRPHDESVDVTEQIKAARAAIAKLAPRAVLVATDYVCAKQCTAVAVWISVRDKKLLGAVRVSNKTTHVGDTRRDTEELTELMEDAVKSAK